MENYIIIIIGTLIGCVSGTALSNLCHKNYNKKERRNRK